MVRNTLAKRCVSEILPARSLTRTRTSAPGGAAGAPTRKGVRVEAHGAAPAFARRVAARSRLGENSGPVLSWADAERALLTLAKLEHELEQIESRELEAVAQARAEAGALRRRPAGERQALAAALESFCQERLARRGDLTSVQAPKSRRLSIGRVGYRQAHRVVMRSEEAARQVLEAVRQGRRFLRVTTEVDRAALRTFLLKFREERGRRGGGRQQARLRRRLKRAGVRLARRDYWFYEVNRGALGHGG